MEKSFAGFPRSYPDGMEDDDVDALAYSPAGFIWDNALAHGKTLRDYGEFAIDPQIVERPSAERRPEFLDYYRDFLERHRRRSNFTATRRSNRSRPYLTTNTVGWDIDSAGRVPRRAVHQGAEAIRTERRHSRTS